MPIAVRVVSEAEFADWLAKNKASASKSDGGKVAAAQE
jgi:heme/copper-type cytochrome/quinol oxidase subunit 2